MNSHSATNAERQWSNDNCKAAFIADLDANFIYVPKQWIRSLLMMKITNILSKLLMPNPKTSFIGEAEFNYCKWLQKALLRCGKKKNQILIDAIDSPIGLQLEKVIPKRHYYVYTSNLSDFESKIIQMYEVEKAI